MVGMYCMGEECTLNLKRKRKSEDSGIGLYFRASLESRSLESMAPWIFQIPKKSSQPCSITSPMFGWDFGNPVRLSLVQGRATDG